MGVRMRGDRVLGVLVWRRCIDGGTGLMLGLVGRL